LISKSSYFLSRDTDKHAISGAGAPLNVNVHRHYVNRFFDLWSIKGLLISLTYP